jgi:hypothetical protein
MLTPMAANTIQNSSLGASDAAMCSRATSPACDCSQPRVWGKGSRSVVRRKKVANRSVFWHGRQKMALERGTNPKLSRRACSPRYGLHSGQREIGGRRKRPPTRNPFSCDSQLKHRCTPPAPFSFTRQKHEFRDCCCMQRHAAMWRTAGVAAGNSPDGRSARRSRCAAARRRRRAGSSARARWSSSRRWWRCPSGSSPPGTCARPG